MFDKSSIPGWVVWICIPLTIGIAIFIDSFQLAVIEPYITQIPGYKFTFISVLMAVGVFHYNFFYSLTEKFEKIIDEQDFNPVWREYVRATNELRKHFPVDSLKPNVDEWFEEIQFREAQINNVVNLYRRHVRRILIEASLRFLLIFSVGLGLLVSLGMDILFLLAVPLPFDPVSLSQNFLLAALVLLLPLFFLFLLSFSVEVSSRMRGVVGPPKGMKMEEQSEKIC